MKDNKEDLIMVSYFKESFNELAQNVTWTSREEAQRLMFIVVIFTVLFSLFIFGVDFVFQEVIFLLLKGF